MDNMTPTASLHSLTASEGGRKLRAPLPEAPLFLAESEEAHHASSEGLSETLGGAFNALDEASQSTQSVFHAKKQKSCPSESSTLGLRRDGRSSAKRREATSHANATQAERWAVAVDSACYRSIAERGIPESAPDPARQSTRWFEAQAHTNRPGAQPNPDILNQLRAPTQQPKSDLAKSVQSWVLNSGS